MITKDFSIAQRVEPSFVEPMYDWVPLGGGTMLIEVSYQTAAEARDTDSRFKHTKYFEAVEMPSRDAVAERLRSEGVDFEEVTMTINPYDEDAKTVRRGNIPVIKF